MNRRLRHPSHRITDNGHYVCGFKRHSDRYSGRVVEDGDGHRLENAVYADWDLLGVAIDHDFGNLVRRKNSND